VAFAERTTEGRRRSCFPFEGKRRGLVLRIEVIHPSELGTAETARWRAYQDVDPALAGPYLTPDWAKLVGANRDDARICVVEQGQAFLGVQRQSRFAAMGLGAPIADYQGVVGLPGFAVDSAALCRALKVGRIDLAGVPAAQTIVRAAGSEGSWIAEVDTAEGYRWGLKERRGKFVKELEKKRRRLEADKGAAEFTACSANAQHFETLLAWKREQLARTGQPPIWSTPWVRGVLDASFAERGTQFGGVFFTLCVDGQLIAANYFLRSERVLHGWVIAHDAAFDAYSPGVQLARWAIEWAADQGIREVDFGSGDYQFKRQLATTQRSLVWGAASRPSWSGAVRQAEFAVRAGLERSANPRLAALPGKAMRRLDLMRALAA
jgi:CelD/BcsL family acetyltransferase involved in cellulose biosynthesis